MTNSQDVSLEVEEFHQMSLLEHLNELRIRVTWAAGALMLTTIISFVFAEPFLNFLMAPYVNSVPDSAAGLQTLSPTEGIETFFKVSLLAGAILAMPMILYQFWLFISPGLTKPERRTVYIFIPSALLLFALGILFAWFVLAPAAISFLANFLPSVFNAEWTGQEYISFVTRLLFFMGLAFELPIVIYFVARVGLVSSTWLREQWRIAVVAVAVLAAVITPSVDPVTMLLTMGPLLVLYIISIFLAKIGYAQFEKTMAVE